jgi:hypothetical protein
MFWISDLDIGREVNAVFKLIQVVIFILFVSLPIGKQDAGIIV